MVGTSVIACFSLRFVTCSLEANTAMVSRMPSDCAENSRPAAVQSVLIG
jgi:hypothetical protein